MLKQAWLGLLSVVLLLGMAGCGGATPSEPVPSPTPEAPAPLPLERSLEEEPPAPVIQAALQTVAKVSSANMAEVTILAAKEVEWPDTSLGCPRPGEMAAGWIRPRNCRN